MAKQVFYSFHYQPDHWRVSQVRNIGAIEGNKPAHDNDWETIKKGGEAAIQKWIDEQMNYRSTTIVLIGAATAGRKWIDYEIEKTWKERKGLVGIHIHRLKHNDQTQSNQGNNPFAHWKIDETPMNQIVKCYNPPYFDSKDVYNFIADNVENWVEEAKTIREKY